MSASQLDVAVRLGGISVILFLAWLLLRQWRRVGVPALLFAPLAVCLAGFLIGNTPDTGLRLFGAPAAAASFASGCTVVFLWWFCLACFDPKFRPRGGVLAVGLIWIALTSASRAVADPMEGLTYARIGLGFGVVAHLLWRLHAEREGDLIQKRYDARMLVALLLGGLLLIDLCVDLAFGFTWRPLPFALAQNAAILGFALWLSGRLLGVRPGVLSFEASGSVSPVPVQPGSDAEDEVAGDALRRRLDRLVEVERIHLDPELSFATFVQRMGAPERVVRKLVNHQLGFDHFRSFLNHYRVREARRLLADPHRSGDKLIAIAFDSGFASLASFNRVFRDAEASTPSAYRDAALAARSAADRGGAGEKSSGGTGFEERSAVF